MDLRALSEGLIASFVGKGVDHLLLRALQASASAGPEQKLQSTREHFDVAYATQCEIGADPYPGVGATLSDLSSAGLRLACVTNKPMVFTNALLRQSKLDEYLHHVVAGDTTAWKKPDPRPLLHACEQMQISVAESMMVGDSINDVQAARHAGMAVACVSYGYCSDQDIRTLGADAIFETFPEVGQFILRARL